MRGWEDEFENLFPEKVLKLSKNFPKGQSISKMLHPLDNYELNS